MNDSAMMCEGRQRDVVAVGVKRLLLLLFAAIGVLVCVGTASASSRDEVGARIINGSSAPAGAWPSIAYLGFTLSSLPSGIATHDVTGTINDVVYTADTGAGTVTALDSGGEKKWSAGTGSGPAAVAIDSAGNVYTANAGANTVTAFDSDGDLLWSASTDAEPVAIAIDSAGNVYTANSGANTVTKIIPGTPNVVDVDWASTGAVPVAIAIGANTTSTTDDDVFTANQNRSTVTKIFSDGAETLGWAFLANSSQSSCTGSVIAPDVILTAAHCTVDSLGLPASYGFARPGVIAISDDATERFWDPYELATHPGYDPQTFQNDVALVVLDNPTSAPAMPLIAPWQDGLLVGGAPVNMAGWGKMAAGGISQTATLQEATVPLISNADCVRGFTTPGLAEIFDPASMLCAYDQPAGIGVCHGDSGGPLAMTIAGTRTAIGVASWVQVPCASGPSVYSRTSAFRSWILDGTTPASTLVRSHLQVQNAAARGLELRSTGSDVTVTWGVSAANWTTTGFRVSINGSAATVTGPTTARTVAVPAGGVVTATVEPQVTLGTATAASISVKPTPTRAPVVSSTTPAVPRVGARLRVTASSDDPWGGAVSYQWLANGVEISGATTAGYRPVAGLAGQWLSLRVAATNAVGTGTTTVVAGRVRRAPQVRSGSVAVTGEARVGGRLQARPSAVTGFPQARASYRWFRNGRRVFSATGAVYRVRPVDAGAFITGRVTWTNAVGTVTRSLRPVTIAG